MGVQNPNSTGYVHPDEPNLLNLHKALTYNTLGEPLLRVLTYSSGGTMDLTALSVTTNVAIGGGTLSYNNTTGVFTFAPADLSGLATTTYVNTVINTVKDRIVSPSDQYATYIDNTGTTYSAGDIIPGTATANLGSVAQPWKDVYVSKGSIVIADQDVNVDGVSLSNTDKYIVIDRGGLKVTSTEVPGREIFQLDGTGKLLIKSEIPAANDSAAFEVIGSLLGESLPIVNRGVMIHSSGAVNVPSRVYVDGVGTQLTTPYDSAYAAFIGRYARGTVAEPLPAESDDLIVRYGGNAYGDVIGLNSISNVRMDMVATERQSNLGRGSRIELWTTPNGSIIPQRSLHIDSAGIDLSEATDVNAGVTFKNGSLLKYWPDQTNNANKILRTDGTNFFWDAETVPAGQVLFKGDWSAANPPGGGTPTISDATGEAGWQWIVSAAGTQDLGSGDIAFAVGDLVIHNGTRYVRIQATTPQVQADWTETNPALPSYIKHTPTLATVATTGSYNDLSDQPYIPPVQINADWNNVNPASFANIRNRPDLSVYATVTQLKTNVDIITANLGSFQLYANANLGTLTANASFQETEITALRANITASNVNIQTLDANLGVVYLGNISTQANLGAFQTYVNANIGTDRIWLGNLQSNVGTINANLGAYQTYVNANIGTDRIWLSNLQSNVTTLDANVGAYEVWANSSMTAGNVAWTANAVFQNTWLSNLQANIGTINNSITNISGNAALTFVTNGAQSIGTGKNTLYSLFGLTNGVALTTNTRYQYQIVFNANCSKAGAMSYALANTATIAQHNYTVMSNKTTTIDGYTAGITAMSFNATGSAITAANPVADTGTFTHTVIHGTIDVTTGGSVNFMVSQDQNAPVTWYLLPGSYVRLFPLGVIGTNTVIGTWT